MPNIKVIFYIDDKGFAPVDKWLQSLPKKVQSKGIARIYLLREKGYELRRPEADYVKSDIYELRWTWQRVNYRILYFFHGKQAVILAHGFTKENIIPKDDLEKAVQRKNAFNQDPGKHSCIKDF